MLRGLLERPKKSQEEDLEKLEREFLASKASPSTKVSLSKHLPEMEISSLDQVLAAEILERSPDVKDSNFDFPKPPLTGFPKAMHRSQFKKRLGALQKSSPKLTTSMHDQDDIHQENLDKLSVMSTREREDSVQEIESALRPSIIEMLKKRAAKKYGSASEKPQSVSRMNMDHVETNHVIEEHKVPEPAEFRIPKDSLSPSLDATTIDPESIYFNASGCIVERDQEHSRHLSCADHTAHLDRESYSIPDLLKLTRSVSRELQLKSLTVLQRIVENALMDFYGDKAQKVFKSFYKHEIFLHLRIALDCKMSVAKLGLWILALLVLHIPEEELVWEDLHYTRARHVALSFSVDHTEMFHASLLGFSKEDGISTDDATSFQGIRKLLKRDVISGLLLTHITDRFKFLLGFADLPKDSVVHMIAILKVMARHSKRSACQIMETPGLAEALLTNLNDKKLGASLLIVFKSLCVASRGNTEKFVALGGLECVMRWVSSLNDSQEIALSWSLLAVISNYGILLPVFRDYRPLMYSSAQSLFKVSVHPETCQSRIGFLKTLTGLAALMMPTTDIGGLGDELKPFVDLTLSIFDWKIDWESLHDVVLSYSLSSLSALFDFFRVYVSFAQASQISKELCHKIAKLCLGYFQDASSKALELCRTQVTTASIKTSHQGLGLQKIECIQEAKSCLRQSFGFDFLAAWIDLQTSIQKHTGQSCSFEFSIQEALDLTLSSSMDTSWARGFGQGSTRFLLAVIEHLKKSGDSCQNTTDVLMKAAFRALSGLIPGDEIFVSRLLHGVLFNREYRSPVTDDSSIRRMTLDLYDRGLYTDARLEQSSNVHHYKVQEIQSLFSECPLKSPCLPIRHDWVLSPFDSFLREEKNGVRIFFDDMKGFILECFQILQLSDSLGPPLDASMKLSQIMKIYLLSSEDDQHFFNDPDIEQELDSCFDRYFSEFKGSSLDGALGGRGRFYQLYTELLEQYAAASFGNRVFGKYLLLPMTMDYPIDYRNSFWTTLEHSLRSFTLSPEDIPDALLKGLMNPKETNRSVLLAMAKVQRIGHLDRQRNSLLASLLESHLLSMEEKE